MNLLRILQIIAAVGTLLTGGFALFWPGRIEGFTGLTAPGPRGITEFRSVFGGAFIGLGLAALLIGSVDGYRMLGAIYLAIAVVRAFSMFYDKSVVQSNVISLATEIVLGVILVL